MTPNRVLALLALSLAASLTSLARWISPAEEAIASPLPRSSAQAPERVREVLLSIPSQERFPVESEEGKHTHLLVGKASDPAGRPLARTHVIVRWRSQNPGEPVREREVTTGASGRFHLDLGPDPLPSPLQLLVLRPPDLGAVILCSVELGENPLPEMTLRPPSLLASGSVIDRSGQPIQRALVRLCPEDHLAGTYQALAVRTNAAGEFRLVGWVPPSPRRLRVLASHELYARATPFQAQEQDSRLALRAY